MPRYRIHRTSEPPIPPQPLPEPALPPGQRAIPLYRKIGGNNRHPHTLQFAILAYAIVDEADYPHYAQCRWSAKWVEDCHSYIAARMEKIAGKTVTTLLAREILGLPRNPGRGCDQQADHLDHNPLNNVRSNLRVVTFAQNMANQRRDRDATHRFRGVRPSRTGYQTQFKHNGSKLYHLPVVPLEAEAAYCYNHVVSLLRDAHAQRNDIPPHELPSPQRQLELISLAESKLRSLGLIA